MSRPQKSPGSGPSSRQSRRAGIGGETTENEELSRRVRAAVERTSTPITVSRLTERLQATDADTELDEPVTEDGTEYGDLHEALYRDYLQSLDAEGVLVFDMEVGLVYSAESAADGERNST